MSSTSRAHAARLASFLAIGGLAFLVDAAVFNLLAFWVTGRGPLFDQPLIAKTIAIVVASIVTYVGTGTGPSVAGDCRCDSRATWSSLS